MLILCLSALFLAAPIPKGASEGMIALIVKETKPELLLLEPNGKGIKRIDLSNLKGQPGTVRLFPSGNRAIVKSYEKPSNPIKNSPYLPEWVYLITLDGSKAPQLLFKAKHNVQCLPNRTGTKVYCSAVDFEKMDNPKPNVILYKCWVQDLKTGKTEPITLPSEYHFVDISADDSTIMLNGIINGTNHAAMTSTKTWKPEPIKNGETHALGLTRNGKQAFLLEYTPLKQGVSTRYCLCDLKTEARQYVTLPEEVKGINAMAFDNDGKRIAYFHNIHESSKTGVQDTYQVFISNPDGRNPKMIYSTTTEMVSGLDWR